MESLDIAIVVVYLLGIVSYGLWLGKRTKTSKDYFVAGRKLPWYIIGLSLFGANISAEHFVGALGTAYIVGIGMASYEWLSTISLILFAFFVLPFFLRSEVSTSVEYLERRFGPSSHLMVAIFVVIINTIGYMPMYLYAGSLCMHQLLGTSIWFGVLLIALLTGIYTIGGGLRSIAWTNLIEGMLIIVSGILLLFFGLRAVGGWSALRLSLPEDFFHVIRPVSDPDLPWPGVFFGISIINIWYWCLNPNITQSALGARSLFDGKMGAIFTGALKLITPFLFIFPGLCAAILYPELSNPDLAGPTMVSELLPTGVAGIFFAGFIASVMTTISMIFHATATIISNDIYKRYLKKDASDKKVLFAGRIFAAITLVLGMAFVTLVMRSRSLFIYIQELSSYIIPAIVVVFLSGMIWKGANAKGSFTTLIFGLTVGIATWLDLIPWFSEIAYLHSCIILFSLCSLIEFIACRLFKERAKSVEMIPAGREEHRGILYLSAALVIALTVTMYIAFG